MPNYIYKAVDPKGKLIKGRLNASDRKEAVAQLYQKGLRVIEAHEKVGISEKLSFSINFARVSTNEMVMFYVQLGNMISTGMPILTALKTLYAQVENKKLKSIIGDVGFKVESGEDLSLAMSKYSDIFPAICLNMVRAGELTGKLDEVLVEFSKYFENQAELKRQIKEALYYPTVLLITGISVTLYIVTFVLPKFVRIFLDVGIPLPLPTIIFNSIGIGIKNYWYIIMLLLILFVIIFRAYVKTVKGKLVFDKVKLRIPILKDLFLKSAVARFCQTLGLLLASGVAILESLNLTKEVMDNAVLSHGIKDVIDSVEKGGRLGDALKTAKIFPLDSVQMIAIGEESGILPQMLQKISNFYSVYLSYTIRKITVMIEPLFLIVIGGMVGFIMVSVILPIFDMMKVLRN